MKNQLLRPQDFTISHWAGGKTTQLFIYPKDSNYAERNFDFRLSAATVEIEKSDFTSLPGYSRKLMILEGEIEINHENHHRKKLQKYDVDSFEGDWKTSSVGKCKDFNVMTSPKYKSTLKTVLLTPGQEIKLNKAAWQFVFIAEGSVKSSTLGFDKTVAKGELMVSQNQDNTLQSQTQSALIVVDIFPT